MKTSILFGFVLIGIFGTSGCARVDASSTEPGTVGDLTYDCPVGDVTLSHRNHKQRELNCTDCHPQPFGMARTDMGIHVAHDGCAKCHSATGVAFDLESEDDCSGCHKE